jgi:hypothetical protein
VDVDDATTRITPGEVVGDPGSVDGPTTRIAAAALLAFAPSPEMTTAPRPMVPSVPPVPTAVVSLAFGEYKLYHESSVRAVDRRLALNRWNFPVMSAVLVTVVAMTAWADDGDLRRAIVGGSGVLLLSLAAHLNCAFWLRQIEELHALHDAKVRILNEMSPYVRYPRTARARRRGPTSRPGASAR